MGKHSKKTKNEQPKRVMTEEEHRVALIKGYEGQIRYCYKRIAKDERNIAKKRRVKRDPYKDIEHCKWLIDKWQERIDKCKNGEPLDFLGKSLRKDLSKNERRENEM